jgi:putative ABC transport system permease protein
LANLAALSVPDKLGIQSLLAKSFPNISVIDVAPSIERILDQLGRMRLAVLLLAALALSAGLSVLASVLTLEANERAKSLILYRTLGAAEEDLRKLLFTESLVVSTLAIGLGAAGSVIFTYGLSRFIFDGAFALNFRALFGFSFLLLAVSLLVSHLASRGLVRRPPLEILRRSEQG